MRKIRNALILAVALSALSLPAASAEKLGSRGKAVSYGEDGSVCYERDVTDAEEFVRKAETAEKAGRLKEAFTAATGTTPGCMPDGGYERLFGIMKRTYKKLGQEAEKAGRLYEAHRYYIHPFDRYYRPGVFRDQLKDYSPEDAHRTMLAHAKGNMNDYEVVREAVYYFRSFDDKPPGLKEAHGLAVSGGDRLLAKEERAFSARSYDEAFGLLEESLRWFTLADEDRRVNARARQRTDTLLAAGSYDSVERAFNYLNTSLYGDAYAKKLDEARSRAGRLGQEAERKGELELAVKFYSLSGDDARKDALSRKMDAARERKEREKEETETRRKDRFKKDQDSLEKELGL